MRIEKIELTNMCMIVNDKNEVLIQDRKKSWIGCAFPGGHVEYKESIVLSTIREVKEETGLDVHNLVFCGIKQWFKDDVRNICFLYKTNEYVGDLLSTEEGENFWWSLDKIDELNLAPSFDQMLKLFINNGNELYHKRENEVIEYLFY